MREYRRESTGIYLSSSNLHLRLMLARSFGLKGVLLAPIGQKGWDMRKVLQVCALAACSIGLSACESGALNGALADILQSSDSQGGLSSETVARGLREALTVGSERVVDTLGSEGGFANSVFHIPLPQKLVEAKEVAGMFNLTGPFDTLEAKMNEAAEAAVPQARDLFVTAIRGMTFADVMEIYQGPADAATQYLKRSTGATLQDNMQPIIDKHLRSIGAVQTFSDLLTQYNALPLVKPIDADLNGHVSGYATDAIFTQLAAEEAAIRQDPLKRTTALLRQVFGA